MIAAYYKLSVLSDEVKAKNKIKVGAKIPRFDCIEYNGKYSGIEPFVNKKGIFKLSLMYCKEFIQCNKSRMAEFALTGGQNLNFSSMYGHANCQFYYGNPNGRPFLKDKRKNPVFSFRNDLFIFKVSEDFDTLEIFVLPNQKGFAIEIIEGFIGGDFDDEIQKIKVGAKSFYDYGL